MFDAILGIQLLGLDLDAPSQLEYLPNVLSRLGLFMARSALLYALGQPHELPNEMFKDEDSQDAELKFFLQWRDQPASEQVPPGCD